jgi:hypothetical protein
MYLSGQWVNTLASGAALKRHGGVITCELTVLAATAAGKC